MAKTITTWSPALGSSELQLAIANQIALEVTAGNTDGAEIKTVDSITDSRRVERDWVSVAAAQNWITFIETLTPAPVAMEIVE
jgi:hypothetical protein